MGHIKELNGRGFGLGRELKNILAISDAFLLFITGVIHAAQARDFIEDFGFNFIAVPIIVGLIAIAIPANYEGTASINIELYKLPEKDLFFQNRFSSSKSDHLFSVTSEDLAGPIISSLKDVSDKMRKEIIKALLADMNDTK